MAIDSKAILRRVVNDVFDAGVDVEFSIQPNYRQMHRALLTSRKNERQVVLRTNGYRSHADVLGLDVSATLLDEVDDAGYSEAMVRSLATVARAYLRGEGHMERRRGLFRSFSVLVIEVGGERWELGRRFSRDHYPD